jgi:hypothetical protein
MKNYLHAFFLLGAALLSACVTTTSLINLTETPNIATQIIQFTEPTPTISTSANETITFPVITPSPPFTPELTPTIKCPNPSLENPEQKNRNISGNIYFWNKLPAYYATYNLESGFTSLQELKPISAGLPGPNQGFFLSFSQDSGQIAYLVTNPRGIAELWVADLRLCQVEKIWEDKDQWLGPTSKTQWDEQIWVFWGPNDLSLILSSNINRPHLTVISLVDKTVYQWSGICNQILQTLDSKEWAIGCSLQTEIEPFYGIIYADGFIKETQVGETFIVTAIDWAFSPDGESLLYIDETYNFVILNRDGSSSTIPVFLNKEAFQFFRLDSLKRGIRWSNNGSRVFVFGYEPSNELCPDDVSAVSGNLIEQPCWFLIDPSNGEIVWWLKKDLVEQFSIWEGLFLYFEVAFSPDDQWIIMSLRSNSLRQLVAISLETEEFVILGNFVTGNIEWGE